MKSFVTFRTDLFNHTEVGENFINRCCFGEDVARWLRARLCDLQVEVSDPIQEDYGWGIWVGSGRDKFWVWASTFDPECSGPFAEWGIGIAYDAGLNLIARFFHKPDRSLHRAVCSTIDEALRAEQCITDVEWEDGEFHA